MKGRIFVNVAEFIVKMRLIVNVVKLNILFHKKLTLSISQSIKWKHFRKNKVNKRKF